MPLRATDNPLVLPLLGLLLEQQRHQYALLTALRERYPQLRVRTGSVYTLVGSLQEAGWIEDRGDEDGPVTFRLTPTGVAEFRAKVLAGLRDAEATDPLRFVTSLAYVGILDRATASATLDARLAALRDRAESLDRGLRDAAGVAPVHMVEVAFVASQLRHDIAWLEGFRAQIDDPAYVWPLDGAPPSPA
jgi:DNA-binding PadR family transcriptional regulator